MKGWLGRSFARLVSRTGEFRGEEGVALLKAQQNKQQQQHPSSTSLSWLRWMGYGCIVGVILMWVCQAEVSQYLQIVILPFQYLVHAWYRDNDQPKDLITHVIVSRQLNRTQLFTTAFRLGVLFTSIDYLWYVALAKTSVATATAIYNSSCIFVYMFSVFFLKEQARLVKVVGVGVTIVGVGILASSHPSNLNLTDGNVPQTIDEASTAANFLHNDGAYYYYEFLVLVSAMMYAFYEVEVARSLEKNSNDPQVINLITGLTGVMTIGCWICLSIIAWLFPFMGLQGVNEFPNSQALQICFINGFLGVGFNIFFMLALNLTSPMLVSVGSTLTIPLSDMADFVLHHQVPSWGTFLGTVFILVGFVLVSVD